MAKATVREKYQGLSGRKLMDRAYKMAFNYEQHSRGCAQAVVAGLHDVFEIDDVIVKASGPLSGGTARQFTGTCGALAGGLLVLGYFVGRPLENISATEQIQANLDAMSAAFPPAQEFVDKFWKQYGTILCPHIQMQLFGRTYWLADPDDFAKFEEAGGHSAPDKCCNVVGTAAEWVTDILVNSEDYKKSKKA